MPPVLYPTHAAAVGDYMVGRGGDEILDGSVLLVVPGEADELAQSFPFWSANYYSWKPRRIGEFFTSYSGISTR
jgi:hypothetical protein